MTDTEAVIAAEDTALDESLRALSTDKALALVKSVDDTADNVKGRTWSLTTWILTVNTGLIAFCFGFYADNAADPGFLPIVLLACGIGVALCGFLIVLINDQGEHLQGYWAASNRIAANHPALRSMYRGRDLDEPARFPRFCARLRLLAVAFALAFVWLAILLICLRELRTAA